MPVYGTLNEESAVEGILKPQQNHEGDTDTTSFWQKYDVSFHVASKLPNKGIPLISRQFTVHPPVYGTLNDNKTKGGYRYTVYCHGIPLYGKKYYVVFHFVLVLENVYFF